MKVNATEFTGYFHKMRERAKAGEVLTLEDSEKVYEFRAVRDLSPEEREEQKKEWKALRDRMKGAVLRYDYEEGPIIPLEEWGNLA